MKWYHYFGMGAGISALLFAAAAGLYGYLNTSPQKNPKQKSRACITEIEQELAELEKEYADLMKSTDLTDKDTVFFSKKPKAMSEKEKALREYLEQNLDMSEISKNEYDADFITEIAEHDGLDFLEHLHDELGLKTIEWSKIKIDSKFYGTNCLRELAEVCKDVSQKEKMYNPALKNFLNYWRKFPKFADLDFSFEQMLKYSKLQLKINFETTDEIFNSLGYDNRQVLYDDISDLIAIDMNEINQAKQRQCSLNDIYMLNLIETDQKINETYKNAGLQAELEGRLSKLEHQFRTYTDENNKRDTNYTEIQDLSQIDALNQLRIKMLLDALQDKEVLAQIRKLALKDLNDNKTEHGGIIVMSNNRLSFVDYPSRINFDPIFNGMYQPSYNQYKFDGICNYHFHAIKEEDAAKLAGPSAGDLNVQRKYKSTGLVITRLDNNKINADFFYETPEGKEIVVDLGNY